MPMQIDLELLLRAAQGVGALQGNTQAYHALQGNKAYISQLTPSSLATAYGCCGLFDRCGDNDLLSLTLESEQLVDWIGWRSDDQCRQFVKLLTYIGPAGTSTGTETSGASTACADGAGVEFGTCEILLPDKGRIKRVGPTRDLTENNRKICDEYPVFMKDGQRITDELMWSITMAGTAIRQDLKRMLITGNPSNAGEFAGLQHLVNTGYANAVDQRRCTAMDSLVLNWGSQTMATEVNGFDLIDYIIDYVRRIRTRARWSSLGGIAVGDQILMMPSFLRDCLLDTYTCWSVCEGSTYDYTVLQKYEGRTFRNSLNGGTFGDGQIFVDGTPLPIITYDWTAFGQAAPYFTGDMYILTRRIGNVPVLWGQYIDMTKPANRFNEEAGYAHYKSLDGGRFLSYWKTDNECTQVTVLTRPNLYLSAPWAQARIQNVACQRPLAPMSPDPTSSYYAESVLAPAVCAESYLTDSI